MQGTGKGKTRRGAIHLAQILEIVKTINSERNLRPLLTVLLDKMIEHCGARRGTIAFFKGDRFNAELSRDRSGAEIDHSDPSTLALILTRVRETGRPVVIDDASRDPRVRRTI